LIWTTVFDASDRRRYEQELLAARAREHDISLELQRALLPGELPDDARAEIEVEHRPAVRGLEVGGDWYDAFFLEAADAVALVVGDVVGKGIGAAATMGQLRSAVRALASTGLAPGALLDALDRYVRAHGVGRMATVAFAQVDLTARRIRYACAGHPPPVAVATGEPARLLWEGRSLPLDAHGVLAPRPEGVIDLPEGGAVVLYTDGLIERRDRPLSTGLDGLLEAVAGAGAPPGRGLARALAETLLGSATADDDVCVLALELH
jgi:serine/threonine-protein kinase RsbW